MLTFRCTQRVLRRLGIEAIADAPVSTTRLGDWYVNLLLMRRHRLLIFVSEPTLLSVCIPVTELSTLIPRFRKGLAEILQALDAPSRAIEAETSEVETIAFGATLSRSVLGSMNDLMFQAKWELKRNPQQTLLELALKLSQVPCKPLGYRFPQEVAMARLAGERLTALVRRKQ